MLEAILKKAEISSLNANDGGVNAGGPKGTPLASANKFISMFKSKLPGTPGKKNPLEVKTHERRDSIGIGSDHRRASFSGNGSGGSSNRGANGNT